MDRSNPSTSVAQRDRRRTKAEILQTDELKKNTLSKATCPSYSPPCTPQIKRELTAHPTPGSGGVPEEPIPDLESEQKYLKLKTAIYKSTPSVPVEEKRVPKDKEIQKEKVPLLFCKDLDEYLRMGVKRTVAKDCQVLVNIIRDYPELGCLYLKRIGSPSRTDFNPYNFVVCNYNEIDKSRFCTITPSGFTEFSPDEIDYLTLEQLETDHARYNRLKELPFFKRYYTSKYLKTWYSSLRKMRWTAVNKHLRAEIMKGVARRTERKAKREAKRQAMMEAREESSENAERDDDTDPRKHHIPFLKEIEQKAEQWKEAHFLMDTEYEETFLKLLKRQSVERKELEEEALKISSADEYTEIQEKTIITDYSMIMW